MMGIVEAPADATIDQTTFYTDALAREFDKIPEKDQMFQITFPNNGFCGVVLKPWGERKRTVFQVMPEVQARASHMPGIRTTMVTPPALPGGGNFPVEFVLSSTAEPEQILGFAQAVAPPALAAATEPISTDRPSVATGTALVPVHTLQFENGINWTRDQSTNSGDAPETELRFGLTNRVEIQAFVPNLNWSGAFSGVRTTDFSQIGRA